MTTSKADDVQPRSGVVGARVRRRVRVPILLSDGSCASVEVVSFFGLTDGREHIALVFEGAPPSANGTPCVRVHSECLTGDVFGSARCDCGPQLHESIELMTPDGGIILYLRQEGRGIGLYNKLDAYSLQDRGFDTFAANRELSFDDDQRDYRVAAAMLMALNVFRVRLVTNNPAKASQLARHGVSVVELITTAVHVTEHNRAYLSAKRDHAGHYLSLPGVDVLKGDPADACT